ncbi:MAG: CDP-alcohol phosphatidyltransferase family protein [Rhodospirillaceae bacterium]|nr:CDP-alcohol phosphatidyltransferase family protein [Rhodospirillaceae bacterium]
MRLVSSIGRAWALTYVTLAIVLLGAAALAAGAVSLSALGPFNSWFIAGAFAPYVLFGSIIVVRIGGYHPYPRFGAANVVTLIRLILTCLFAGLAVQVSGTGMQISDALAWFFLAVAVLALVLDGFDGYLARRQNLASRFGSRFDMETDALQILLLSITVLAMGKAGAWVLIGGLLRYIYVAAGWLWPVLNQPLRPSWRRKIISVVQGGVLTGLLTPIITPPFSAIVAAAALVVLIYSFAKDVVWILRGPVPERLF